MVVNYCSMTVNYGGILTLEIIVFFTAVIYHGKLPQYFYNIGLQSQCYKNTVVNYRNNFNPTLSINYSGIYVCHLGAVL